MTFKERYLRGDCSIYIINDWVEAWRANGLDQGLLPKVLGLSENEYRLWAVEGEHALAKLISEPVDSPYLALHLDWEELGDRLNKLVQSLLGTDYKISVERVDYYYWELKLDIPTDVDEDLSAKIYSLLNLQEVHKDHFTWPEDVWNTSLNGLLGKLVQREVDSNHADDYGVWVICKDGRFSAKEDSWATKHGTITDLAYA